MLHTRQRGLALNLFEDGKSIAPSALIGVTRDLGHSIPATLCAFRCRISYDQRAMALMAITCVCGHVGVVAEKMLPCNVTCSRCGSVQHVEQLNRPSITAKVAAMADVWLSMKLFVIEPIMIRRIRCATRRQLAERAEVDGTFKSTLAHSIVAAWFLPENGRMDMAVGEALLRCTFVPEPGTPGTLRQSGGVRF